MSNGKMIDSSVALVLGMVCVLFVTIVGFFIVSGISVQNSYNNIQNQNKQLQTWLADNETQLNQKLADNANLQEENTNLTNQLASQNDTISSLNAQISQLESNLTNIQNQLIVIRGQTNVILYPANIDFYGNGSRIDIDIGNSGTFDTMIVQVYIGTSLSAMFNQTIAPVQLAAGSVARITMTYDWQSGSVYYFKVIAMTGQALQWSEQAPTV